SSLPEQTYLSCEKVRREVFFFFSSRRRHTRFDCDWSSDVCSSDLVRLLSQSEPPRGRMASPKSVTIRDQTRNGLPPRPEPMSRRSEERRVGKECRSRWSREH